MNTENAKELLRVVLDTNVYVSAFNHKERQIFQIWQQAVNNNYILLVSPPIIKEIAETLRDVFNWEEKEIIRHLKLVVKIGKIITPKTILSVIQEDLEDNRILECAVDGKASIIVSGNKHLQRLKIYEGIAVIRPIEFIRTLGIKTKKK